MNCVRIITCVRVAVNNAMLKTRNFMNVGYQDKSNNATKLPT